MDDATFRLTDRISVLKENGLLALLLVLILLGLLLRVRVALSIPSAFSGIFLLAIYSGGIIKTTFFPNPERNDVEVTLQMKQGTTEKKTKEQWHDK